MGMMVAGMAMATEFNRESTRELVALADSTDW